MSSALDFDRMNRGGIDYSHGQFTTGILGGDATMMENGWAFWFHSGSPCSYYTRSKAAVLWAVTRGHQVSPSAAAALADAAVVDDPEWATIKERERLAKLAAEEHEMEMRLSARDTLIESARAKLTSDEFQAIYDNGYEDGRL